MKTADMTCKTCWLGGGDPEIGFCDIGNAKIRDLAEGIEIFYDVEYVICRLFPKHQIVSSNIIDGLTPDIVEGPCFHACGNGLWLDKEGPFNKGKWLRLWEAEDATEGL